MEGKKILQYSSKSILNSRFVVVCGDGEYILYTAMTLRSKTFGNAMEFVWSQDSSEYAIRDGDMIKIFKNFKEVKTFKPSTGVEGEHHDIESAFSNVESLRYLRWISSRNKITAWFDIL